jgi:NAD(P)-dependent dehydrogenase (short-subunit alcohol dehydrogenase family)
MSEVQAPNKAAVITGAAGGIGQALVRGFAAAGHAVIATDVVPCPDALPCDTFLQLDLERTVADPQYADECFAALRQALRGRRLAALVNNAAVQILGGVEQLDRSAWQRTLNVNLLAPFVWTQALLPELEQASGAVVNISSIHARLTKPQFVAYATSKAALSGMTRAMAQDLRGRVRVNAIEPAAIATDMLVAGFADRPDLYAQLQAFHPTGRIGRPSEVAELAVWLASDAAAFVHGSCLALDGGIGASLHDPA